jgi:hypothetical protein
MKLLCMSLILANIALFFWEYRNGALQPEKPQTAATANPEAAKILIASELDSTKSNSVSQDNDVNTTSGLNPLP